MRLPHRAVLAALAALVVVGAGACSNPGQRAGAPPSAAATSSSLTLKVPASDAREVVLPPSDAGVDGNLRLTPLGVECGITYQIGTHAEIDYSGQLCRLHLAVQNLDKSVHAFQPTAQRLIDRDGAAKPPDQQAMDVARQLDPVQIGGNDTAIVTLFFALAKGKIPQEFVLHGDHDPTGIGTTVTAPHLPNGLIVVIPRRALYTPHPI